MWVYILIQPGVRFCHISQQSAFTQVFDSCWSPEISVFSTFSSPCQQLNMEKELSCEVWCSKKKDPVVDEKVNSEIILVGKKQVENPIRNSNH